MSASEPDPPEDGLEAWLAGQDAPRPSPEARARIRRAFLAGEASVPGPSQPGFADRRGRVMPHGSAPRSSEEEPDGFAAWVAERSSLAGPSEGKRLRARLAFLSTFANLPPAATPSRSFRALVWVAAAAAILLVTLFVPEPVRWHVRLDGALALDGQDFTPGEEDRLAAELERSGWVETRATRAGFELGGTLEVELTPGSSLRFPPLPDFDGLVPLELELARGEAYVRTLEGYPGNPIRVHTEVADVTLSGTTVGVLVDEAGTCVCVAEGRVRVTSASGSADVPARETLRLFHDNAMGPKTVSFATALTSAEASHVQDLLEFHGRR